MSSRDTGRAGLGILALVATIVVVTGLDHPALGPTATDLDGWTNWARAAEPVGVVMGVIRVAALCLSWYLLIASVLAVLAHLTHARPAVALAAILPTGHARDLVVAVVGTGLLAGPPLGTGNTIAVHGPTEARRTTAAATRDTGPGADAAAAPRAGAHLATTRPVDDRAPATSRTAHGPATAGRGTAGVHLRRLPAAPTTATATDVTMVRLGPDGTVGDGDDGPRMQRLPDEDPAEAPEAPDRDARFTVAPGDHFWRIAEAEVATHCGRDPADHHVRDYWLRLVEANRDLLVDPGNADLLLPGQVLRLPPVDGGGAT